MHTPEQASILWCPMARVAQFGNTETQSAYNRSLTKQHRPARMVKVRDPEDFELGQDGAEEEVVLVLDMQNSVSRAAMCIAENMWRFAEPASYDADRHQWVNPKGHGYCGLAGRPEIV